MDREATPHQAGVPQVKSVSQRPYNNIDMGDGGDADDCCISCDTSYRNRERNGANNDPKRDMDGQWARNGDGQAHYPTENGRQS